jgi:hypothetical protein
MSDILACIKFGCKGTIATLIAEATGDVGDWFKYRKFLPVALPEGIRYGGHASYNLKTMQVGMEVISTDEGRTKATELKGGLMGIYGSMYAGAPLRFALIAKDKELYLSGLMAKGYKCMVTPTGKESEETVSEAEVTAFMTAKKPRNTKRDEQDIDARRLLDRERKRLQRVSNSKSEAAPASKKQEAVPQHTQTHTHTHTHRERHRHRHRHRHSLIHMLMHTHTHTHTHTCTHTHTRTHACHAHACHAHAAG